MPKSNKFYNNFKPVVFVGKEVASVTVLAPYKSKVTVTDSAAFFCPYIPLQQHRVTQQRSLVIELEPKDVS